LPARSLAPALLVATVLGGVAVGVSAVWPALALALVAFFVGGVGNGVVNVAMRTLVHHRVPDELRGRVFSAYYGLAITTQIGATALAGAFVAGLGSRGTLLLGGFGGAAMGLIGVLWYAGLAAPDRAVEERAPSESTDALT
jgi:MFS family permease